MSPLRALWRWLTDSDMTGLSDSVDLLAGRAEEIERRLRVLEIEWEAMTRRRRQRRGNDKL